MPLIKLNRINKGGEIYIHSEHIVFVEMEAKSTTVHLTDGLLFSIEETPAMVADKIEELAASRIANGLSQSGATAKS
jgi:hypothetical protein